MMNGRRAWLWRRRTSIQLVSLLLLAQLHCFTLAFSIDEATIESIHVAFSSGILTSTQLTNHYLLRIASLNPLLHAVIEVNPDALLLALRADRERKKAGGLIGGLHGIPVLLKDNIATLDKLNTTAGSFALLGSKVPRDAGVVARLRRAGAIILGKANLSEWANYRSNNSSNGWSARGGQTKNPYVLRADPCGSSTGSAVGVAANLATVSLGTETDGSILCPASRNAVVGIKPTVGLSSRAGVVPISHHQDTVGPLCRTVADAVEVLDAIVGFDPFDKATATAADFIPKGGYKQFLKVDGLRGKRLGIVRRPFFYFQTPSEQASFDKLLLLMKKKGAQIVDNLTIPTMNEIFTGQAETTVLNYDFKQDLNSYLEQLLVSPVRSLADAITFNNEHAEEKLSLFGQEIFYEAENTTGFHSKTYRDAVKRDRYLTKHGIDRLLKKRKLDAIVAPSFTSITSVAAIAGYPGISVPAGYTDGVPFGICIVGKKGWEPTLIQIAYSLEQATLIRKPPSFLP